MISSSLKKYSGAGNNFYFLDDREASFPCDDQELIISLCKGRDNSRKNSGVDGLILLQKAQETEKADFRMRIFNRDGSEAEMCGNGLRCLVRFISDLGIPGRRFRIESLSYIHETSIGDGDGLISCSMQDPTDLKWDIELVVCGKKLTFHQLNTGVPHLVTFVEEGLDEVDVVTLGREVRFHPLFQPNGVNVNFACFSDGGRKNRVDVRTYERGVEGETLACGTGATAVALATGKIFGVSSPVEVVTRSGEGLIIVFSRENEGFSGVWMKGPGERVG